MRQKPFVGQILYSLNIGNAARHREQKLTPVVVKSVGRLYFVAGEEDSKYTDTQYHLEDWREKTEFSATSALYTSEQELQDELEETAISRYISNAFGYGRNTMKVPLSVLKEIEALIKGGKPECN